MTFNRVRIVCLFLSLAAIGSRVHAQNGVTPASSAYVNDGTGVANAADFSGSYLIGNDGGTYFLFDKMIGDGPAFDQGYSRFGIRAKLSDRGDSHLWTSGYVLITDDTRVGVNAGGGYRWLNDGNIIGLNAWFDSYSTNNHNRFSQFTAGFEMLRQDYDFRINGYLPFGDEESFLRVTDPGTESVFTSRGIGFLGRGLEEQAMKGVDAEVGTEILNVPWARVYGGGYWYDGKSTSFGGFRGRVETAISPDFSVNFIVQNDSEYDTNYNMSLEYRFSGGLTQSFFAPFHGESRKYHPVRRQWPIATRVVDVPTLVPLLNPKTGTAFVAAFVDNTNAGPGDGSLENPFSMLPDSVDADGIFVWTGVGETLGNITLQDCQVLLGQGKAHTFEDPIRGTVTVPAEFTVGGRPILRAANPAENVVTLANMNRVANFDILGPAPAAIGGTDITDFEINMVDAFNVTDGFHIANASGRGVIIMSHVEATDQNVFISNTGGDPLNLMIDDLTTRGGTEGLHIVADAADVNASIDGFRADDVADAGMILDAWMGGNLNAVVTDALVGSTGGLTGTGFRLNVMTMGSMAVDMQDIAARGNNDLFVVDVQDGQFHGTVHGGVPGFIAGADFSDSGLGVMGGGSGVRVNLDNAVGRLSFSSLFANRNAVNGIETDATGAGTDFLIEVRDSRLIANGDSAFDTDVTGGAMLRYFVDPTFATMSGVSGFEYNVGNPGTVFIAEILQTDFTDSMAHAVDGYVYDQAEAYVHLTDVFGDNAGLNGYNLLVDQGARFVGTADNVFFTLAGDAGVDLTVNDGSSASLMMVDVMGQTNGDYGLRFNVADGVMGASDLFLSVTNGDFNSNPDSNIMGTVDGAGSIGSIYFDNVTADDMGANGSVVLAATGGGILNTNWTTGSVSQGDADGFVLTVNGVGSQMRLNLNDVSIGTNAGDGIDGTLSGGAGSLLNISLVDSAVTLNGGNGIDLAIDGPGATSMLLINNTPVLGNFGGDGLEFDVTGGAGLGVLAFGPAADFSGNLGRAWDGSVDGMGSYATVTIDGANAIGSGLEGGLFEVTGGGLLNLNLSNLIIGDSPLDGLLTTVDGAGSVANIVMSGVTIQRNGLSLMGDGFEARATNGGGINATLTNMSVVENREDGFLFDSSGAGSVILARLENIIGDDNGRHGLEFHASTGGEFSGEVFGASFNRSGSIFIGNGVFGTARDAGSVASILLDGVSADNASRMGFEFDVRTGATLLADVRSGGAFGDSSGSGNAGDGVRFYAQDPGTMGFLKMMGPNTFDNNVGNGINYDAVNVDMAVAGVSGTMNGNGLDGINIAMLDVTSGAISLEGAGPATITGNGGDGINISTQNVNLIEKTINGMLIDDFLVDGFTIGGNGGDPIIVSMGNTTVQDGEIINNTTTDGMNGILVTLNGGAVNLVIDNNVVSDAVQYGISVTSGSGMHDVKVTNNSVTSSGDTNIYVDLFGTTETGLMIDNNTVVGGGLGTPQFTVGTNFTGMTLTDAIGLGTASIPPDTMGAVGPNHIVEFVNQGVTVFNKDGSVAVPTISMDQFFLDAGLADVAQGTFDPRIIYDPTVDRWFVAAIDTVAAGANNIYLAVSNTSDPTAGFQGLRFVGDSVDNIRFNDFDMLGVDADGLYISTNNFGGPAGFDVSVFSIPKSDLLAPVPTVANMTRFENLDVTTFGESIQPAVDFGPSDGVAQFLGTLLGGGTELTRSDVMGAGGGAASINLGTPVTVPFYAPGPGGRQPNPGLNPLIPPTPRFHSNVIEIGDSLWAVHDVLGTSGNSAARWYEIDANTNTVLQTGLIEDPNLDFVSASINVNPAGAVVIGFTGSGPGQFASSMAAFGTTDGGGVTTFQTPIVLAAGTANYQLLDGFGRNRWGDYSATVVDPADPNTFWTFQELVVGPNDYGVQMTQITFSQAVLGGTVNDGIHVDVRNTARLTPSTINGNTVTSNGDDGIEVLVMDTAAVDSLEINGNDVTNNGDDGIRFETLSPNQVGALTVSANTNASNNVGDGIEINLVDLDPAVFPDVLVEANMVDGNMGRGIAVNIIDSSVDDVSVSLNTVRNNLDDGVTLNIDNTTAGVIQADAVMLSGNDVRQNSGDGILVQLNNLTGLQSVDVRNSTIAGNTGRGLVLLVDSSPIDALNVSDNAVINNTEDDGILLDLLSSPVNTFTILRNQVGGAPDDGIDLRLDDSAVGDLQINNNSLGMVMGMSGGTALDDSLPVVRTGFDANNLPANDDGSTGAVPIGFNIDFFGQVFSQTFVNNNGNITFTGPLGTFTPFDLLSTATPIIAPFFADVDTGMGNIVTYGPGLIGGQAAFGVNWPGVRHFSVFGTNQGLPENTFQLVLVDRSDLAVGDFDVEFNYEQILWEAGTASGSDEMGLGGFSARAGLSNGVDFALELPGSAINGAFLDGGPAATSLVQNSRDSMHDGRYVFFFRGGGLGMSAPSGGDGLSMTIVNNSDIGALTIDGNMIDGNGAHGIDIDVQNSTLPATGGIVSNNTITNHANGDGFRMLNADTNGNPFEIDFVDNTISDNGASSNGVGINISLSGAGSDMTSTMTGNTIENNGSLGVSFTLINDSSLDLTVGDSAANQNMISGNTDAGIGITTADTSVANITVENTAIMGTVDGANVAFDGDGLAVHSSGFSLVEELTIGNGVAVDTGFTGNAGSGIEIVLSENARNPNVLIQNVVSDNNSAHGISLVRAGFSSFSEDLDSDGVIDPNEDVNNDGMLGSAVITMTSASGNGGNGLDFSVSGSQLPVQQLDVSVNQNSFNNNTVGMNFVVNNDAMLHVNAANNVVMGNSSHGVNVTTNQNAAFGNVFVSGGDPNSPMAIPSTFSSNVVAGNGGNGFNFVANDASIHAIDIDDAGAVNALTGTNRTVIDGNAGNQVQITGNGTSQQNIDLTAVNITNTSGVATGDGVNIDANATSTVDVSITGGSIIGALMPQIALPGLGGNGITASTSGDAILNLDVDNADVYNNAGDAINIRNAGPNSTGNQAGGTGERQTIQATFNNVDARFSGDQGLDVILDGNVGGRMIAQGDTDSSVLIDVSNSNFSSNVNEGIFFRAAPGATHGGDNFYADLVAEFNVTNSIIQSNGTTSISDGLVMEVGTNAYVLSTIAGNMFGANGADDFHTNSFDSGAQANTAQLDLSFQNNSGDHIRPTAIGATVGGTFFILDNAFTVEANNMFELFGVPQMEVFGPDGFFTNGYILRPVSNHGDPTFPP